MSTDLPFVQVRESAVLFRHGCASQLDLERLARWAVEHIEQMDEIAAIEQMPFQSASYCRSLGFVKDERNRPYSCVRKFVATDTFVDVFPETGLAVMVQADRDIWLNGLTNSDVAALAKLFKAGRDKT
jgi:hypothetical protein